MTRNEIVQPFRCDEALPIVTWNIPYDEACDNHISRTLDCSRPFLIISRSMSSTTDAVDRISKALSSSHIAGIHRGMKPHTWYSEVLEISKEIEQSGADSVITIGGGSIIDGAKAAVFAVSNAVDTMQKMDDLFRMSHERLTRADGSSCPGVLSSELGLKPSAIPIVTVSTTLSGGEYNHVGGASNDLTKLKQLFVDPALSGPRVIVLDPVLTLGVPQQVWLSTGMRAIDHSGLKLLIPALLRTAKDPKDLDARLAAQRGACESMKGLCVYRTPLGASHGIGHQLGPFGVPHAETSCILLPAVLKYNYSANYERQAKLFAIMWEDTVVSEVLRKHSLSPGSSDLGDLLDAIICELELPRSLRGYRIGKDQLRSIAKNSLKDAMCRTNPIPITTEEQVMAILEKCF
ncbi:hypothetical protein ANOM_001616 [Aspergillus nomiae NRRL 13137]|uniref:Alcohol dehydrogenase iron-type/glycerol dehydrogenase GldA domain-containing protein n=1 Tax=Aspergillus nomiae NRRL (strain ATCC 15546 / NRRL 13137 / CBS 260.88 / M93) TaxID=1509407 RepID=A0A0L1JC08_ASPN3|nr:uncharacterized protein ANOM_001616 [Aspergillus nomiae NRRL 13137]KNG89267.1 hypothetical protein ANOM_001616 [Aspergillus nomiae NRRL 13137]